MMFACPRLLFGAVIAFTLVQAGFGADGLADGSSGSPEAESLQDPTSNLDRGFSAYRSWGDPHGVAVRDVRLPAEFERQRALMIACRELISTAPQLILDLTRATRGRVEIMALVSCVEEHEAVIGLLRAGGVSYRHVHFVELNHDTMWARDYGPMVVQSRSGRPLIVDADYDFSRGNDDRVPDQLANLLHLGMVRVPLRIDGGNLISNGAGLALTTYRLIDENADKADEDALCEAIGQCYGVREVAILEPLAGEATGHVDMFATFTSENSVVVGQCDPDVDPENAAILDRNAEHLATMRTSRGRLRVTRIPMPTQNDGVWRTYTNVIFANGALLVPTYSDADALQQRRALATYAKLMPHWRIITVDASRIIESQGALHCITMNLGPLGKLPRFPRPMTRSGEQLASDNNIASEPPDVEQRATARMVVRANPLGNVGLAGNRFRHQPDLRRSWLPSRIGGRRWPTAKVPN